MHLVVQRIWADNYQCCYLIEKLCQSNGRAVWRTACCYRAAHAGGMFEFPGAVSGSIPESGGNFSGIETEISSNLTLLAYDDIVEKF